MACAVRQCARELSSVGAACLPASLGQWRETQRYEGIDRTDEDALTRAIIELASEYGRWMVTVGITTGSCVRLRPERGEDHGVELRFA